MLEYIGQLEGELAVKSAEADNLRVKNDELMAENTRLTDLTRMLLSSSAFSTFLADISGNAAGSSASSATKPPFSRVKADPLPSTRKDVNPHQAITQPSLDPQSTPYVAMAAISETTADFAGFESTNNAWADGTVDFGRYDAQVFTITDLPQGPAVDQIASEILSGKSKSSSFDCSDGAKTQPSLLERMPLPTPAKSAPSGSTPPLEDVEFDESDPAYGLFADCPTPAARPVGDAEELLFGSIEPEKAFRRLELVVENRVDEISASTMETFERICSSLEAASERISALLPWS